MTALIRALHAETLKLKRTLAVRMIFVAPLLVALLQFFIGLNQRRAIPPGFNIWEVVFQNSLSIWAIFMLPLLITLETALLAGIEHSEKQWKHLLALPVPRYALYGAKLVVALALALASTLVLCGLAIATGYALIAVRPAFASAAPPAFGPLFVGAAKVWLASWLIIAIHTWIGLRWSGFVLALGAGVAGTFFALFAASARLGKYYPWLLPVNALNLMGGPPRDRLALLLGIGGGLLVAGLAALQFARRDGDEPASGPTFRLIR